MQHTLLPPGHEHGPSRLLPTAAIPNPPFPSINVFVHPGVGT